jgi:peptide/nickel transport system substrate-binding protein
VRRVLAAAVAAVACVLSASAAGPRPGGTISIAGPLDCPNIWFVCISQAANAVNQVIGGAFRVGPDLTYRPNLVSRARVTTSPFAVTYTIRRDAVWSDRTPVSAADFLFTYRTFSSPRYARAVEAPLYARIRRVEPLGQKVVRVVFKAPFAGWRDLFHSVFPEHALAGENLREVWTDGIDNPKTGEPISNGPFLVSSFVPGELLTLERNPRYWGPHTAYLDKVVFRRAEDAVAEIDQLRVGGADAVSPQVQQEVVALRKRRDLAVRTGAGTTFEHVSFRLGSGGNPLLRRRYVRQAIAFGIDRAGLVRALFVGLVPSLRPLQNLIFVPNGPHYAPHWQRYRASVRKARDLLEQHGCRRGADGVYACAGERLSFRFATTAGNPLREETFSILRSQLARVGIELVPVFSAPSVFFGQVLANGDFDLAMFTWVNTPDPGYAVEIWRCGGHNNFSGYCNRGVSADLLASNRVLSEPARARMLNRVDMQLAADLPAIPLFQKPTVVAYKRTLHGVVDNPTEEGWTWNLGDWWVS